MSDCFAFSPPLYTVKEKEKYLCKSQPENLLCAHVVDQAKNYINSFDDQISLKKCISEMNFQNNSCKLPFFWQKRVRFLQKTNRSLCLFTHCLKWLIITTKKQLQIIVGRLQNIYRIYCAENIHLPENNIE